VADTTTIEWTDSTWNPVTSCTKISPGCDHCLAPETRILFADMTWRPLSEVRVGDVLVGFSDDLKPGQVRTLQKSVVKNVWSRTAPTVEITVADRTVVASDDHQWLTLHRRPWRYTRNLRLGNQLRLLGSPLAAADTADADYRAGYIAGVTAGDGTLRWDPAWRSDKLGFPQAYWRVAVLSTDRAILDRLVEYLAGFGITVEVRNFHNTGGSPMLKVEARAHTRLEAITKLIRERNSTSWMAGWLAGVFDTDGSYNQSLRISQRKENGLLVQVQRFGKELGFDFRLEEWEKSCSTVRLTGDLDTRIRFLTSVGPALERKCADFYGRILETPTGEVTALRRGPVRQLIDIETSTGTFIAEGICTHNCYAATFAERWRGTAGWLHFQWPGRRPVAGPRNVAIRRSDGSIVVRPFRGLTRSALTDNESG
jgi:hypothetical protein